MTAAYETILLTLNGDLATLTFNRPERLNSFTVAMHEEVRDALERVETQGARCLLITGAGRGFCAGQDLADRAVSPGEEAVDLGHSVETYWNPLILRLMRMPIPVIIAVNGVAAGAGANIAIAGDIVLAARSAKFIQSFAHIGLIPDSGGTWNLPRAVGLPRALGMALTGDPVDAETAESWGLIWKCVEDDALMEEATSLATRLAAGPTLGLAATKKRLREAVTNTLDVELDEERDAMRALGYSKDYAEGVAAFTQKRKPAFKGE